MIAVKPRTKIMATLDVLDQHQTEKVLDYIKGILHDPKKDIGYMKFKEKALREIRDALSSGTL